MSQSLKALSVFFAFAALAAGIYIGNRLLPSQNSNIFSNKSSNLQKLSEVLRFIENDYVDTVDTENIENRIISMLLQELDPHSEYISAEEFNEVNDPLMGSFDGIGVQFNLQKDTVLVVQPVSGGPSEKAGIRAGDRIVTVNGELIAGKSISNQDVMKKLKGPRNTKVNLGVFRRGNKELLNFTIIRGKIPTNSIDVAYLLNNSTGYIKISRFSSTTRQEFDETLETLLNQGIKSLILDLRGNGGGMLQSAVDIADQFLAKGSTVVYTQGRSRSRETFKARSKDSFEQQKLIVLIDEFSASASEIIAGAIQDNDRGWIVGRRSFGKGLVQEQVSMKDGSAIRLTVARYYTPSGRCIQSPYDDGSEKYFESFMNRLINPAGDTIQHDTMVYFTKGGRKVYGGGGILPDFQIPYDTLENTAWYNQLSGSGLIYNYAIDYTDANRRRLEGYKNAENFARSFRLSSVDFQEFLDYCQKNKITGEAKDIAKSKEMVISRLEAYIARNVFGERAFYPFYLKNDKMIKKALEICSE